MKQLHGSLPETTACLTASARQAAILEKIRGRVSLSVTEFSVSLELFDQSGSLRQNSPSQGCTNSAALRPIVNTGTFRRDETEAHIELFPESETRHQNALELLLALGQGHTALSIVGFAEFAQESESYSSPHRHPTVKSLCNASWLDLSTNAVAVWECKYPRR